MDLVAQFGLGQSGRETRQLAVRHLEERGYAPASDASCAVALVVAEPAANAVLHGRVPGHGESGRGLLLVDTLAVRWGSAPRHPLGKTVWAEVPVAP